MKPLAQAFKLACDRIESGQSRFICVALTALASRYLITFATCEAAQQIIRQRLGQQHETLEDWIRQYHASTYELLNNPAKVRQTRLAWLTSLIKEHK